MAINEGLTTQKEQQAAWEKELRRQWEEQEAEATALATKFDAARRDRRRIGLVVGCITWTVLSVLFVGHYILRVW